MSTNRTFYPIMGKDAFKPYEEHFEENQLARSEAMIRRLNSGLGEGFFIKDNFFNKILISLFGFKKIEL